MAKVKVSPKYAMMLKILISLLVVVSLMAIGPITIGAQGAAATPPDQPSSGPGGSDYAYDSVKTSSYGSGELKYWIFEPDSPTPDSAPVVVFNHGFLATDPAYYIGWIKHLTRKGNIVIFPAYQKMFTSPSLFTDNAVTIVKNALTELKSSGHITPVLDKFAIIGHSAGGAIAINLAARAAKAGLPAPKALILAEASDGSDIIPGGMFETDALSSVPNTLLVAIVGSEDTLAGSAFSEKAIKNSTKIPAANKNMIVLHSDDYGSPALKADHIAALAPELPSGDALTDISMELWGAKIDAMDYYGFWKPTDGLIETAFGDSTMRKYALGNTPELRYMGEWSDGKPVKELEVKDQSGTAVSGEGSGPENLDPAADNKNNDTDSIRPRDFLKEWNDAPVEEYIQEFKDILKEFGVRDFLK